MSGGWHLSLVGWSWWTVLPLAALGFLGVRLLARRELLARSERERRGLLLLRGAVAALLVLIFLEPILSRQLVRRELPVVSVLVDASGSMAVCDAGMGASAQLDEAIALGLLPEEARDNSFGLAAELLEDLGQDLPALLTALERSAAGTDREGGAGAAAARLGERCGKYVSSLQRLSPRLAGQGQLGSEAEAVRGLLASTAARLGGAPGAEDARSLQQSLRALQPRVAGLVARCRKAQRAADAALVTGAGVDSPVTTALGQLETMSRFERVKQLTATRLAPLFEKRASARFRRLDRQLGPIDLDGAEAEVRLEGGTDFAGPLGALAQSSGEDRLSGVLLLSDGRQTAGGDPTPALRALRARGIRVGAVSVGDPAEPRDAAVSEILGSREVFQGETVRLDVRFRIVGYEDVPWDLILTRGGEEVERRTVCGSGRWQTERFEVPAEAPGLLQF